MLFSNAQFIRASQIHEKLKINGENFYYVNQIRKLDSYEPQ